jgi:hypothetical protein
MIAVVALAAAPAATAGSSSGGLIRVSDLGTGAAEVWVLLPAAPPPCVITFIHAEGDLSPGRYLTWLNHLALDKHCAVIFPRYQAAAGSATAADLRQLRSVVATGIANVRKATFGLYDAHAPAHMPMIAAGVGSGATLALDYAAYAKAWGLPVPVAVDSMFPVAGASTDVPSKPLAPSTDVLVQVGDRDRAGGKAAGQLLWKYLASHAAAEKRYVVVRSTGGLAAVAGAPVKTTPQAETTFWTPLDKFIDAATGG